MKIQGISFVNKINVRLKKHRVIKKILGGFLLALGIIAFVTPLTPGAIWLIIIGLELLGFHFLFWRKARPNKLLK